MTDAPDELILQLPCGESWLHAHLVVPRGGARVALLMAPPLVEERKASQRAMVDAARLLAREAACAVLRCDYRGCGDAAGDFEEFTPEDWIADIQAAAAWLAARHPGLPQAWLGIRAGALLLSQAAPAGAPAALLFWEPVEGAEFLRQLLQRRMVNDMLAYGRARTGRAALAAAWERGETVDLDGFAISARQWAQLRALRFLPFGGEGLQLVTGPESRAAEALAAAAPHLQRRDLRLAPFWNSVGHVDTGALAQASAEWLRAAFALPSAPATVCPPCPTPAAATASASPPAADERPVTVALGGATLRGILHAAHSAGGDVRGGVVFLGGWSGDRQGPHRLFVRYARQLAAARWTCLRCDYRGRGESDGEVAQATVATMTDDAGAAVQWLAEQLPPGAPIVLVAICSGCKAAIATAVRQPAVSALALWSAEAMGSLRARDTNLRKTLGALRAYGRKLLRPETWRKLLRGQVRGEMVGKALVRHETRSPEEARAEDAVLARFRGFRGPLLFVYGGSDPDAPAAAAAYARFCRRHGLRHAMEHIAHAGHSYYGLNWSHRLLEITDGWLQETAEASARGRRAPDLPTTASSARR